MIDRLIKIRKHFNKTQEAFAELIGISRDTLAQIETKKQNPSYDLLRNLHHKCDIDLNWLICGSGKMKLTESVNTNMVNEPQADYGLKAAYEAQRELLKYKDEEIARLKECCKMQDDKDKAKF